MGVRIELSSFIREGAMSTWTLFEKIWSFDSLIPPLHSSTFYENHNFQVSIFWSFQPFDDFSKPRFAVKLFFKITLQNFYYCTCVFSYHLSTEFQFFWRTFNLFKTFLKVCFFKTTFFFFKFQASKHRNSATFQARKLREASIGLKFYLVFRKWNG